MFYLVRTYRPGRGVSATSAERTGLRVLGAMNEYQARLLVAEKALQLGRGGISRLAQLTGMSRVTITQGVRELISGKIRGPGEGRVRQPGGGRKKVEHADYGLLRRLKSIVEETTAGDPAEVDQQIHTDHSR